MSILRTSRLSVILAFEVVGTSALVYADGKLLGEAGGAIEYSETASTHEFTPRDIEPTKLYTGAAPMKFDFYPMAGIIDRDIAIGNFVDLDVSQGLLDWDCSSFTYNSHDASDAGVLSFGEQAIGVPIFAVADGLVYAAHDGEFDMNTCPGDPCGVNPPANYVLIDHGNGVQTYYYHMKSGSVAVHAGDYVRAGRQIGLVGSSGNSSGPHLHFATYYNGEVVEPWAGNCRMGESWWSTQLLMNRQLVISDFGITHADFAHVPGLPYELPREGQIALSDPFVSVWFTVQNLPANSTWRFRFMRPNGTIAYTSNVESFNNPYLRNGWYVYGWIVDDMHSITGTWHVLLDINGENVVVAPFEVRTERTSDFNRPPEPIQASFLPVYPTSSRAVFCKVINPFVLDDLDYDIVRYEYVWRVNGTEIRRITSAARTDAIPLGTLETGDSLACTVTPSDGKEEGESVSLSSIVDDADGDGLTDGFEIAHGLLPHDTDTDNDGLTDGFEVGYDNDSATYIPYSPVTNPSGTDLDATVEDTDGDGISDSVEISLLSNPLDPLDVPILPTGSNRGTALLVFMVALVIARTLYPILSKERQR